MRLSVLLALSVATCNQAAPTVPEDAGEPPPSVPTLTASPPPPPTEACAKAFNRRKELGCPPREGLEWMATGCLDLNPEVLECESVAPSCFAASECE